MAVRMFTGSGSRISVSPVALGLEWAVYVMPWPPMVNLVLGANFIGPPCRLHEQHAVMVSGGNVLKPRLPLVRVPGMFFQDRC